MEEIQENQVVFPKLKLMWGETHLARIWLSLFSLIPSLAHLLSLTTVTFSHTHAVFSRMFTTNKATSMSLKTPH